MVGKTRISSRVWPSTSGKKASKKARDSRGVLYIFQLPAMIGLRMWGVGLQGGLGVTGMYGAADASGKGEYVLYWSERASTPGRDLPSRNSRLAPPPVEIWLTRSA